MPSVLLHRSAYRALIILRAAIVSPSTRVGLSAAPQNSGQSVRRFHHLASREVTLEGHLDGLFSLRSETLAKFLP